MEGTVSTKKGSRVSKNGSAAPHDVSDKTEDGPGLASYE